MTSPGWPDGEVIRKRTEVTHPQSADWHTQEPILKYLVTEVPADA